MNQLREIAKWIADSRRATELWAMRATPRVSALFVGPAGTGKTMAAEVLAQQLGLPLHRIDMTDVVSKYIGETEKNLDRLFQRAGASRALLLFDGADALFGKRDKVGAGHDRYASTSSSYLLQRLGEPGCPCILTADTREGIDEAFLRRINCILNFPLPDAKGRTPI